MPPVSPASSRNPVERILALFDAQGALAYGESVTQLEHALQCAQLARDEGANDALITAALLHDMGHLIHRDAAGALRTGTDDEHEALGAVWLGQWFGEAVTRPIALHVQAKRYLCATEPDYHARLSPVSVRSLELQGGPLAPREAAEFGSLAFAQDAVRLRRWDDQAKCAGLPTPALSEFLSIAARCRRA